MKVYVHGLWHLGSVTAACVADAGFATIGLDDDKAVVAGLREGRPPLFEPGLAELVATNLAAGRLSFDDDVGAAADADVVWVTFDTPVDDEDRSDTAFVENRIRTVFPLLKDGAVVLVSSQLPVGTIRRLAAEFCAAHPGKTVGFACSPENLRLGQAIDIFKNPGRIVVGTLGERERAVLEPLLSRFSDNLLWMSLESAEMVKHAINAFLATSITLANEIASLCERSGADAGEVEKGLRSEPRIGPKAYIRPGPAFAGGTLARDVTILQSLGKNHGLAVPLLSSIIGSNAAHRQWALHRLAAHFGKLDGKRIAVLGLTYKPGTDTLRRSSAVELCQALATRGCAIAAYDPAVKELPATLAPIIALRASIEAVLEDADALVLATDWPDFRSITPSLCASRMRQAVVLDQSRFFGVEFAASPQLTYMTIGKPT